MTEIGHNEQTREQLMKQMTPAVRNYHLITIYPILSSKRKQ
jgi:hypothetical protein